MTSFEFHAAKLVDVPLITRLTDRGVVLDSEMGSTREAVGSSSAILASFPLAPRAMVTLVGRAGKRSVVGQFRLRDDDRLAQIAYIAPGRDADLSDTAWLHLFDAMTAEAGRRGAQLLAGEIDELDPLFVTMRTAGFAVYARQQLWRRVGSPIANPDVARLYEAGDADVTEIQSLCGTIVPKLVQPVAFASGGDYGLVYRQDGDVQGYIAVSEGRVGVYLLPFLHPDILYHEARAVIASAAARAAHGGRLPVTVCVRRYQDWLEDTLAELGFEPCQQQAVMVRHIAAGVRARAYSPLAQALDALPAIARPQSSRIETHPQ